MNVQRKGHDAELANATHLISMKFVRVLKPFITIHMAG